MFRTQLLLFLLLASVLVVGCYRKAGEKAGNKSPEASGAEQQRTSSTQSNVTAATSAAEEFEESDPVKLTPEAVKRFSIRVEKVRTQTLTSTFIAPAKVSLNMEAVAHVGSPVSGRIVDAKVRAGDSVNKGDALLIIDSPELGEVQSDLLQKRTALTVATSSLEIAKSGYERAKRLLDQSQGIALTEVQKREAEYKAADGTLISARAAVSAAENKLKLLGLSDETIKGLDKTGIDPRYTITSPLTGKAIERSVTLGELVRPERESLLVVADMSTLWVLANVPEAHRKDVAVGSKVRITLPADSSKIIDGVVSFISPRLDEFTRTILVRVELPADGSIAMPGMFAEAAITAPTTGAPSLVVPETAVQTIDGKPNVFVPVKGVENAFVARRVKTGEPVGQMVPVLGGLKEGDLFVATGSFILKADLGKGAVQEEQ